MKAQSQRGVALVMTLVLLAVVTFMAITFLAVSRRERTAVSVTDDQTAAKLAAEAASARAQTELLTQMLMRSNLLAYDLIVSTNFINRSGFDPRWPAGDIRLTNVNYDFMVGGLTNFTEQDRLKIIANLQFDARAPVYVSTNEDATRPLDFRFFLDLNRNHRFETNGFLAVLSSNRTFYSTNGLELPRGALGPYLSNFFVGDPEWNAVFQRPDQPHSASNRAVARYAYLVAPVGKTLDLNFIHNNANQRPQPDLGRLAYYRSQGHGSWELNLAAFLRDLNTNIWRTYSYGAFRGPSAGDTFLDAREILRYRYGDTYASLAPVTRWFGPTRSSAFRRDYIDMYADGFADAATPDDPRINPHWALVTTNDNDVVTRPWAGSDNPYGYFDPQELFNTNKAPSFFHAPAGQVLSRFAHPIQTNDSSYDRYTFYRLLAQAGTDSAPVSRDQINLNYNNLRYRLTNLVEWNSAEPGFPSSPVEFVLNAAARCFDACKVTNITTDAFGRVVTNYWVGDTMVRSNFGITNISLFPVREYTPTIHRLLQVAVNIYDATSNRVLTPYPHLPTVLRPVLGVTGTNIFIRGYTEITNTDFARYLPPLDLNRATDRQTLARDPATAIAYDVPFLIGAKKGLPNFNEFWFRNIAQISRKLEVRKNTERDRAPVQTNQMYMLSVSNQFGLECWNSYTQAFKRELTLRVVGDFMQALATPQTNAQQQYRLLATNVLRYTASETISNWPGGVFRLPINRGVTSMVESVYAPLDTPPFRPATTNDLFDRRNTLLGYYVPDWTLLVTNRFYYLLLDANADRVVDFVSLANMTSVMPISRELAGRGQTPALPGLEAEPANTWTTNRADGSLNARVPTTGIINQMRISLGDEPISEQQWRSYSRVPAEGLDKPKSIDRLRAFVGLTPLVYNTEALRALLRADLHGKLAFQAGYTPTRKLYQDVSWQVDDPLVHYLVEDLLDPMNRPNDITRTNSVRFAIPPNIQLTNSNLGFLNDRYRPWGGNPNQSVDLLATDARVKDPGVQQSDDWEFPTNKFPSIGWLGRVHRGTPWQTLYLKSGIIDTNVWYIRSGSHGTHPTNDWKLLDVFTVAPVENASRGLLSVNQANLAAWSAVLAGVSVLTNTTPVSGARTNAQGTYAELFIRPAAEPGWPQLSEIVAGINRTRSLTTNGVFLRLGDLLATPELTLASPFLSTNHVINEFALERIPQQVLSLLKADEPRFVIYAFGQALKEAPSSIYLGSGPYNRLCTNYQVRAEFATKTVIRIEGPVTHPRTVVESYNELPTQ